MRTAVIYQTSEGQSARIAARIVEVIRSEGGDANAFAVGDAPSDLDGYDAIVVGGSIHLRRHDAALQTFINRHLAVLTRKPSAFFSVSLAAASKDPAERAGAQAVADELLAKAGWTPMRVQLFAGSIAYTRYGFLKKRLMRKIARAHGESIDTSHDVELTDWGEVEEFARDFYRMANRGTS